MNRALGSWPARNPNEGGSPGWSGSFKLIEAGVRMVLESRKITRRGMAGRLGAVGALVALCAALTGCGLAAAPCRVASAGLKIVPLVGHVAAAPTDACAAVIDP
jgi:hypothetical protein